MLKVSELLGKSLLSLADATNVGYIGAVWFDAKLTRAKTAEIFNDDDDDRPERTFVEMRHMQCDGDAAVIKSQNVIAAQNLVSATAPCPINCQSFNQSGKALGKVRDVLLENNEVTGIVCERETFTPKELLSLSDNMCIFNDTGEPIKLAKSRPPHAAKPKPAMTKSLLGVKQTPPPAPAPTPATVSVNTTNADPDPAPSQETPNSVSTPTPPQSVTVTRTPGEPVKDYSFLLGKPVHSPVQNNGQIIIPAGTVVTEEVIELARRENKLVQLALRAF